MSEEKRVKVRAWGNDQNGFVVEVALDGRTTSLTIQQAAQLHDQIEKAMQNIDDSMNIG